MKVASRPCISHQSEISEKKSRRIGKLRVPNTGTFLSLLACTAVLWRAIDRENMSKVCAKTLWWSLEKVCPSNRYFVTGGILLLRVVLAYWDTIGVVYLRGFRSKHRHQTITRSHQILYARHGAKQRLVCFIRRGRVSSRNRLLVFAFIGKEVLGWDGEKQPS